MKQLGILPWTTHETNHEYRLNRKTMRYIKVFLTTKTMGHIFRFFKCPMVRCCRPIIRWTPASWWKVMDSSHGVCDNPFANWKNTRLSIAKSSSGCLSSISMGHGFRSKLLVITSGYLVFNQNGSAYWISPVKFVGMVVSWHDLGKCPWHITWGWKIFRKVWDLTGNPWNSCGFYTLWIPVVGFGQTSPVIGTPSVRHSNPSWRWRIEMSTSRSAIKHGLLEISLLIYR